MHFYKTILIIFIQSLCLMLLANQVAISQSMFQTSFGGISYDYGYDILQSADGSYYILGQTYSFGAGSSDIFIRKLSINGTTLASYSYGTIKYEEGISFFKTSKGFIVVGMTYLSSISDEEVLLMKLNSMDSVQWSKAYRFSDDDFGNYVRQTTDGGYIIAGYTDPHASASDVLLIKTDSNGTLQWANAYGGYLSEEGNSVLQTKDGGYLTVGFTSSFGGGQHDIYLIKTNSNGNVEWTKTYGGNYDEIGYDIQATSDEAFIITGLTASYNLDEMILLLKIDSMGNLLWAKSYTGREGKSVRLTMDDGYIISGTYYSGGYSDILLIKTDSDGNPQWTKALGSNLIDEGYSIQQTTDSGYIIVGRTDGFANPYDYDVYLIKTDQTGNSGCNEYNPIINSSTIFPTVGSGGNKLSGGVDTSIMLQVSKFLTWGDTLCLNPGTEEINSFQFPFNFIITPNLVNGTYTLISPEIFLNNNCKLKIFNVLGRVLIEQELKFETTLIDVSDKAKGVYLVQVLSGNELFYGKIVSW